MTVQAHPENSEPGALRPVWLFLARAAWLLNLAGNLTVVVFLMPRGLQDIIGQYQFQTAYSDMRSWLSQEQFARVFLSLDFLVYAAFTATALFLVWRKPDDVIAILTSALFISVAAGFSSITYFESTVQYNPGFAWLNSLQGAINLISIYAMGLFLFLFPDGRFVPRIAGRIVVIYLVASTTALILLADRLGEDTYYVMVATIELLFLGGIASQVYRYRVHASALQRQQTKLLVMSLALFPSILALSIFGFIFFPLQFMSTAESFSWILMYFSLLVIPVTLTFSILRYRLWEIDLLIRRTLVYSALTSILLIIYLSSVILLQAAVGVLGGQDTTLITVTSTLAIAGLFNPLRRRIQQGIDQRFYRQKYDADQALAEFAAAARSQADLSQLVNQLDKVVQVTIQPETVSIWLYSLETPRQQNTSIGSDSRQVLLGTIQPGREQKAPGINPLLAGGLLLIAAAGVLFVYQIVQQNASRKLGFEPLPVSENIKPVIIDTDMAPDDWMAILFLLQRPEIDVLGITVSGTGEAHCEPGVRNALGLVALAGESGIPVACGRETPLEGNHVFPDDWRTNADTMSGLALPQVELPAGDEGAVELLTHLALESPKSVSILTLGPLTNLAEAVQQEPALAEHVDTVVIMGGALAVPGNVGLSGVDIDSQVAEWNFYIDPFAVKIVFGSGLPVLLVPLDATNDVALGSEFFRQLKANRHTPEAEFVYQVLAKMQDSIASGDYYFWDPLAAGLLVDPSLGAIAEGNVKTFTAEGPNSGLVRVMADGDPIRYASSAQAERFYYEFLRTLNQP